MDQGLLVEMKKLSNPIQPQKQSRVSRLSQFSVRDIETALQYMRETWKSGMSQAILNWPFHLSIGNNSGTSGSNGMTTAFIAAFVNGFFSGSNHSIYMPSWVITAYTFSLVQDYEVEILPWVTFLSGILIYLTIIYQYMSQKGTFQEQGGYLDYTFGLTDAHSNRGLRIYPNGIAMLVGYYERGNLWHAFASFMVFAILQIGRKISKPFLWIIVSCCTGVALGVLFPTEHCLRYAYGTAEISFNWIGLPDISIEDVPDILLRTIPIAIFITAQNLLCARGAQTLTGVKCDYDQETLCVSVANMVSGLCGGYPAAPHPECTPLIQKCEPPTNGLQQSMPVRFTFSMAISVSTFWICPYIWSVGRQCSSIPIPTSTVPNNAIQYWKTLVALICYNYGAIESTIIGSLHALFVFAKTMSGAAFEVIIKNDELEKDSQQQLNSHNHDIPDVNGSYVVYRFNGAINYINIKTHIEQIQQLNYTDYVIFSFRYVSMFDDQAIDKLAQFIQNMKKSGCEVMITGLHSQMITEMVHNIFFKDFFRDNPQSYQILGC